MADLRRVRNRIWAWYLAGTGLFFLLLAFANRLDGSPRFRLDQPVAWLLLVPAACFVRGAWISLRQWRCPDCGAPLTTEWPIVCRRCGRRFEKR